MTAFESAWIFLKNAPVPNYAQPKQPSDFTAIEDERKREAHTNRNIDGVLKEIFIDNQLEGE